MAVVDPARAAIITKEYRYKIREESSIQAQYPLAREIVRETALDLAGASALADTIFAQTGMVARTFTVEVEGVLYPEDFINGFNRYTVSFDHHPAASGGTYALVGAQPDYFNNRTLLTVRG